MRASDDIMGPGGLGKERKRKGQKPVQTSIYHYQEGIRGDNDKF